MIWPPTLRTVGTAAAVVGAVALVAPFAWQSFWPTPIATIDEPDARAWLAGCFVAKGRVLPSTIWKPLWLIEAWGGSGWRPVQKIDPTPGTWQSKTCVHGRTRGQFRLALVIADRDRDDAFRQPRAEPPDDPIPDWLKRRGPEEQCGGARPHRGLAGFGPIPDGTKLVASTAVRVLEGDEDPLPCIITPLYGGNQAGGRRYDGGGKRCSDAKPLPQEGQMTQKKRATKRQAKIKSSKTSQPPGASELTEEQLDKVAGGAEHEKHIELLSYSFGAAPPPGGLKSR